MRVQECIAYLNIIRDNIGSDGEIPVGSGITALTDAICYAEEHLDRQARQYNTERGNVWLVGQLGERIAKSLGFSYAFTSNGKVLWSRCTTDINSREFVIIDNYSVMWLDLRER